MKLICKYVTSDRAYCWCPFHNDKKGGSPSLVITLYGENEGKYYCYSCGRCGQLTKTVLNQIRSKKKKGSSDKRPNNIDWTSLNDTYSFQYFDLLLTQPNTKPFDVSTEILHLLSCGWDGEAFTFPTLSSESQVIGIQRRFSDGFKCMVDGSRVGLFIPVGAKWKVPLIICEGVSDTATMMDLGYSSIGRFSADTCIEEIEEWLCLNGWEDSDSRTNIYIMSDGDACGRKGAEKLAKYIGIDNILIPEEKDIRKTVEVRGKENVSYWLSEVIK